MDRAKKKPSVFQVGEILSSLSSESDSDKAFRMALFNGIAVLIVLLTAITVTGIYFILQPFLKPLLWALIAGSVLHPLKQLLAGKLRTKITQLGALDSRPFYLSVLCIPFSAVFRASDSLGDFIVSHKSVLLKAFGGICALVVYYFYMPNVLLRLYSVLMTLNRYLLFFVLEIFGSTYMFVSVLVIFTSSLHFFYTPERKNYFYVLTLTFWVACTSWISNYFGYIRLPVFVLIQFVCFGSFIYSVIKSRQGFMKSSEPTEEKESPDSIDEENNFLQEESNSMRYIKWLSYICLAVLLISVPSSPYIFTTMLILYTLKHLCLTFGLWDIFQCQTQLIQEQLSRWFLLRKDIIYPEPLRESLSVLGDFRKACLFSIRDSCDSAAAVAVILALLFLGVFSSVFLTLQAYRESVYLIQVGGDVINKTIIHNPDLHQLLPEDWQETTETALNNAYLYAREGIATLVRSLLANRGIGKEKSLEIEAGALELWDRAYQAWVMPIQPKVGPTVTPDAVLASCNNFLERLYKTPEVMSLSWATDLVKENMAVVSSGLDSAWSILKGNMSLLLGILSTLFSILFGGGMSLINFTIHSIIFLTALFYLLSTSREMYRPVELITQISPKYGKRLALAVENACQEVLAASAKLSIFYGLWTWLIHNIFQSNLAYMPAVFAGILGVVPVFGTYWVCVPAMVDLWFVQESKVRAIGLFIAQIFPTAIVETVIYNEIKGGHPYLTGLSVAGGIFWLGIEGAIVGPLLLCLLFITLNILSSEEAELL